MKATQAGNRLWTLLVAACAVLLLFSVGAGGLWMDEGQTHDVVRGTFGGMVRALSGSGNAISGMPLYFCCEFFWCRAFGYGEFALRSMNYVFALLVLLGSVRLVSSARLPRWTLPLFAANPLLVYYMNEARPYAALYALGLWGLLFLAECDRAPGKRPLAGFFFVWLLACAFHLMAVFAGIAYLWFAWSLFRRKKLVWKDHLAVIAGFAPFFAVLGFYYLRFAFGAPERGFPARPVAGIVQIVYSFAGFGGLGWSRNAFRDAGLAFSPRIAVELSAAVLAGLGFLACCAKAKVWRDRRLRTALGCLAGALTVFVAANVVLGTRFWERHVIYLAPVAAFAVALACQDVWRDLPGRFAKLAVGACVALFFHSGVNIAFLDEFAKEDYRVAVESAWALSPDHVFFQGNRVTFEYYGIRGQWGPSVARKSEGPVEGNVNVSCATWSDLKKLLARAEGRTVLLLLGRKEFDEGRFFPVLSPMGRRVAGFAVVDAADIPADVFSWPEVLAAPVGPPDW